MEIRIFFSIRKKNTVLLCNIYLGTKFSYTPWGCDTLVPSQGVFNKIKFVVNGYS